MVVFGFYPHNYERSECRQTRQSSCSAPIPAPADLIAVFSCCPSPLPPHGAGAAACRSHCARLHFPPLRCSRLILVTRDDFVKVIRIVRRWSDHDRPGGAKLLTSLTYSDVVSPLRHISYIGLSDAALSRNIFRRYAHVFFCVMCMLVNGESENGICFFPTLIAEIFDDLCC